MDTQWLDTYEEETAIGPVQRDEALLLYAITRVIRPRRVLEFGTYRGHSAKAFLEGGAEHVTTVDINPWIDPALGLDKYGNRLSMTICSMDDFESKLPYDLIFFDASHCLELNQRTWINLDYPKTVLVHDTGAWAAAHMTDKHREFRGGIMTSKGMIHQPAEVRFVEWLQYAGYDRVDFHSENTLRHGITILQKR
jgi:predicted O-methyltransferase YrrM